MGFSITGFTHDGLRLLAWVCFTLSVGIVIGVAAIVAVSVSRPALDPVVALRWDDVSKQESSK